MLWWHPGCVHWSAQRGPSSVRASFIGLGGVGGSLGLLGLGWFRGFSRLGGRRVRRP
nr:MAG TPA: 6-phosphogluconate dehydrogenase [Caudoviricetes sp.]